jgi:hypothetical protein
LSRRLARNPDRAPLTASGVMLLGALLVGGGYSLRPWRAEIAAVPEALRTIAGERTVLVQSGLYPHAGYDERVKLLTPATLDDPRHGGAAMLLAGAISAYPFGSDELRGLMQLPRIRASPSGLLLVRIPEAPPR